MFASKKLFLSATRFIERNKSLFGIFTPAFWHVIFFKQIKILLARMASIAGAFYSKIIIKEVLPPLNIQIVNTLEILDPAL